MITLELLKQSNRKFFSAESMKHFNTVEQKIVGNLFYLKNEVTHSDRTVSYSYPVYTIDHITKHLDFSHHVEAEEFEYAQFDLNKLGIERRVYCERCRRAHELHGKDCNY